MPTDPPPPPVLKLPDPTWPHFHLYGRVREAVRALHLYFRTETYISGIAATDLHTLNTVLGAALEEQAVATLNAMRKLWDPDEEYKLYSFVRQPQTFPDVLLRKVNRGDIIMGIELKGWYLLAKEGVPSYRYRVTPTACAPQDLLVVVPWALSNVLSGSPAVFDPYMESARHAAEVRNYHWQYVRDARSDPTINSPADIKPYPMSKSEQILDQPVSDSSNNFGRFARSGFMDEFLAQTRDLLLCGVRVNHWLTFLRVFAGDGSTAEIAAAIASLRRQVAEARDLAEPKKATMLTILAELRKLADIPDEE